ncbi:hypothetical protein ACFT7S_23165 [Streptomyces sp. NPDC057136]|uniref:hypothetical protein n=1 Tax=Streptomyces sp. NPDC057136 TaxID=3346029 RepID=UPI00363B853B
MAILDDEFMRRQPRPLRRSIVLCCVSVFSIALAAGCTNEPGGPTGPSASESSPGQQGADPSEASARAEKKLGKQVEEVLDTAEVSDGDPTFVEAGLERVSDGFHTEPELIRGRSYKLAVACAGKGKISLSVVLNDRVRQTVQCDGVPLRLRITASAAKARIVTEGIPGVTGMVAWRLDKADR